jgi:hypothetical protein
MPAVLLQTLVPWTRRLNQLKVTPLLTRVQMRALRSMHLLLVTNTMQLVQREHMSLHGEFLLFLSSVKLKLCSIQGRCRQRCAPRTRLLRNRQMHTAWHSQMPDLTKAFLRWKHNQGLAFLRPDPIEENNECKTMVAFQIATVSITSRSFFFSNLGVFSCILVDYVHVRSVNQCDDELANVSLIKAGYLGGSPVQPMLAMSLECLKLYHQIR